jgi:hypothetical protein
VTEKTRSDSPLEVEGNYGRKEVAETATSAKQI